MKMKSDSHLFFLLIQMENNFMNLYNCLNKKVFITNKTRLFKCEIEFKTNLYNNVHTLFFQRMVVI